MFQLAFIWLLGDRGGYFYAQSQIAKATENRRVDQIAMHVFI